MFLEPVQLFKERLPIIAAGRAVSGPHAAGSPFRTSSAAVDHFAQGYAPSTAASVL